MLHEYMGYFYDYGNVAAGGGIHVLERPGYSLKTREIIAGRLTNGNFTTLALSHDARTIYFAFSERSEKKPDFNSPQRKSFHIYAMSPDGSNLRQLTSGVEDDFDPCPLPDGGVAFMSSRRGGFARCNNPWEPCASYTLHRMDADGQNIRTLSVHETSEWHPSVMNDGRLVYIRWDYVDRSAANFHGLWTSNPDGTAVGSIFGNYTMRINACYQPRPIPGSDKLLFLAGAHHADVGGSLVMLDPRRVNFDPKTGEDVFDSIEALTPEICFPESTGWPKSYFHSPWPLSEYHMLVAFSFDPLPGMSSGEGKDTRTGLYYFDRFGNLELLYQDPAISCMYPLPLKPRDAPAGHGHGDGSCPGRRRGVPGLAMYGEASSRCLPIVRFGSCGYFRSCPREDCTRRTSRASAMPTRKTRACCWVPCPLNRMAPPTSGPRPESRCISRPLTPKAAPCKACAAPLTCSRENGGAALAVMNHPAAQPPVGQRWRCVRAPSRIVPGPEGSRPFSFPLLVQPVLDRHCVRCHDGEEGPGKSKLALTVQPAQGIHAGLPEPEAVSALV